LFKGSENLRSPSLLLWRCRKSIDIEIYCDGFISSFWEFGARKTLITFLQSNQMHSPLKSISIVPRILDTEILHISIVRPSLPVSKSGCKHSKFLLYIFLSQFVFIPQYLHLLTLHTS